MTNAMTQVICGKCGIEFWVPEHWRQSRQDKGDNFYCPNGDIRVYSESTVARLEREKSSIERALQAKLNEANHGRLVAEKARDKAVKDKRKVERRVAHGVCPCCNKTFADLSNHMVSEHKDFRLPGGKEQKRISGFPKR